MRNIKVYFVGIYQAVIADNRNTFCFCFFNQSCRLRCVLRRNNQNINALCQKIFDIVCLFIGFVVGNRNKTFDIHLFAMRLKSVMVALPAFLFDRRHRKTDFDFFVRVNNCIFLCRITCVLRCLHTSRKQNGKSQKHQKF